MTLYSYKAISKDGILQKGMLDTISSRELKTFLRERDLSLISYSTSRFSLFSRKVKPLALMDLCLHLEQFEEAGIPLKESLEELKITENNKKLKSTLINVIQDIENGYLLSKSFARHPLVFDSIFIGLISVGEKTGRLSFVFHQLFCHLKWIDEVKAQTLKALRYPFIMATVLLTVMILLMTILVPELVTFIQDFSEDLPSSTWVLIWSSRFLTDNLLLIFLAMSFIVAPVWFFLKLHRTGPIWKDRLLTLIPFFGSLRQKLFLARFCHVFAILFESGVDILQALRIARRSLSPGQIQQEIERIETLVREGQTLSMAFQKSDFFPSIVVRMIKLGEQTSSLHKTLLHVKTYFDTTLKREVDHIVGLIEPLMILSVGCLMGWIIFALFLPLYDTLTFLDK
ncbi:MAG: type II secretion system F family protein [Alphaproteobacteria bacterium]|nr:type II secretion system F family protein [Alphaproteobacteria bacterium]